MGMTTPYQGEVYLSPSLDIEKQKDARVAQIIEAFKVFWRTGYHADLGKDVPFHRPKSMIQSAIRHVHLRPLSSIPDAKWLKSFQRLASYRRPPSDRWLTYCVTEHRNCMLISYVDEKAHALANDMSTLSELALAAEWFFKEMGEFPLSESEHTDLFEDKWLL